MSPVYVRNHTGRHTDLQGLEDGLSVGHEDGEGFGAEVFSKGSEWFQGFQIDLKMYIYKKHKPESQCVEVGSIATSTSNMIFHNHEMTQR